ncbi:MAG: NYN domain-containing protein [Planctomycetia bacterium]|nr:NYN domain-containing protein [Planctomycetia bacterium]
MAAADAPAKVAVYWDFENIHAGLVDARHGEGAYRKDRQAGKEKVLKIEAVMDFVATIGDVVINRAYADWRYLTRYRSDLLKYSIDLVQLFPRGSHAKNGADIRLALDALEDVHHFPYLSHVVVVSGDSDFIGVAQKIRQAGREVIGIGVEDATNPYWIHACNQFKLYRTLLQTALPETEAPPAKASLTETKELLAASVKQLMAQTGEDWVLSSSVKSAIRRLNPAFDETRLGYRSFKQFLRACADVVKVKEGTHDRMVALLETASEPPRNGAGDKAAEASTDSEPAESGGESSSENGDGAAQPSGARRSRSLPPRERYEQILRKQRIELGSGGERAELVRLLVATFDAAAEGVVPSLKDVLAGVVDRAEQAASAISRETVDRFVDLVYKARQFRLLGKKGVALVTGDGEKGLSAELQRFLIQRIINEAAKPVDVDALAELIADDISPASKTKKLVDEVVEATGHGKKGAHPKRAGSEK